MAASRIHSGIEQCGFERDRAALVSWKTGEPIDGATDGHLRGGGCYLIGGRAHLRDFENWPVCRGGTCTDRFAINRISRFDEEGAANFLQGKSVLIVEKRKLCVRSVVANPRRTKSGSVSTESADAEQILASCVVCARYYQPTTLINRSCVGCSTKKDSCRTQRKCYSHSHFSPRRLF